MTNFIKGQELANLVLVKSNSGGVMKPLGVQNSLSEGVSNSTKVEKYPERDQTEHDGYDVDGRDVTEHIDFNDEWLRKAFGVSPIRLSDEFPPLEGLLSYRGKSLVSRRNIMTIQGKAKTAKTFLLTGFAMAMICGSYGGLKCPEGLKVLFIDAEQCATDTHQILCRIKAMADEQGLEFDESRIKVVNLRTVEKNKRLEGIEIVAKEKLFDVIVIDGVRDLLYDINSPEQCDNVVCALLRICDVGNCSVATIIHENKNDTNARGHIGSELMNKSETVVGITKADYGNYFCVRPEACRHEEFDKFSFQILPTDDGVAIPVIDEECRPDEKRTKCKKNGGQESSESKDCKTILERMEPGKEYTKVEIYELAKLSGTTGNRRVKKLLKEGKLIESENKKIQLATVTTTQA